MFKSFMRGLGYVPVATLEAERAARNVAVEQYTTLYNQAFTMQAAYMRLRGEYQAWLTVYHAPTAMAQCAAEAASNVVPFKRA